MMHKSPLCRMVGMVAWVITAVAAIIMGLMGALNIDIYGMMANSGLGSLLMILDWVFLIFGGISLVMFFMALSHHCGCKDGQCNCK